MLISWEKFERGTFGSLLFVATVFYAWTIKTTSLFNEEKRPSWFSFENFWEITLRLLIHSFNLIKRRIDSVPISGFTKSTIKSLKRQDSSFFRFIIKIKKLVSLLILRNLSHNLRMPKIEFCLFNELSNLICRFF